MNAIIDFILYNIISVLIVLGVLVFCHELGHFLLAKLFKVKVLKFALGFGPKIVWKQMGETEYSIRWIPLGGFVKLLGEDDDEEIKKLPPEEAARALDRQPVFKKIAILAAGSIFNLILAVLIFTGIYLFIGETIFHLKIIEVIPNAPAQKAGIMVDDRIVELQGKIIKSPGELQKLLLLNSLDPVEIAVFRDNKQISIHVIPRLELKNMEGEEVKAGMIGIKFEPIPVERIRLGPGVSLLRGVQDTWGVIEDTFKLFKKVFQRHISFRSFGSIIGVAKATGDVAKRDLLDLFPLTAWLSITIGLLNLFPIPILDGSLIVIAIIEAVMGKQLSMNKKEWIFKIGLAFLITLMLFATYNDIFRLIRK